MGLSSSSSASSAAVSLSPLVARLSASFSRTHRAADACAGPLPQRLSGIIAWGCDHINRDVAATTEATAAAVAAIGSRLRQRARALDKRLDTLCEELDANVKIFGALSRQLETFEGVSYADYGDYASTAVLEAFGVSMGTVHHILDTFPTLPSSTAVITTCGGSGQATAEFLSVTLSAATHVQLGVDSARSIVFHEPFMAPCHPNTVKLTLLDGAGSPVMGVTLQDIHFQLMGSSESPNCNGWTIGTPAVEGNTVTLPIAVEEFESAVELTRAVTLVGDISTTGFTSKLHALLPFLGKHDTTLQLEGLGVGSRVENAGLAVNADGTVMAVCSQSLDSITLYSLPSATLLDVIGSSGKGLGQLFRPEKVCFSPVSGHVIVADYGNKRVQEFALTGKFIRTIGEFSSMVSAVTTSASVNMLAVACCGSSPEGPVRGMVRLYDLHSGSLVQSFGEHGIRDGQLSNVAGMRFTADGQQLVLVEAGRSRLSLFDCRGAFLRFIGDRAYMRQPHDVDFAPNGDMIVVDKDNSIFVFAGDGFSLKRRFGRLQGASGPGYNGHEFMYPTAIACHGGYVYILDSEAPRVHVFQ